MSLSRQRIWSVSEKERKTKWDGNRDEKTHDSDQIQNKGGENEGWERQEK